MFDSETDCNVTEMSAAMQSETRQLEVVHNRLEVQLVVFRSVVSSQAPLRHTLAATVVGNDLEPSEPSFQGPLSTTGRYRDVTENGRRDYKGRACAGNGVGDAVTIASSDVL